MSNDFWIPTIILGSFAAFATLRYFQYRRRLAFIDGFEWPTGLVSRLQRHHPTLSSADIVRIEQALRQFFRAYLKGGRRYVSMPSQAADDLWHEFILYTKAYDAFCRKAFGRFLHHTPAVVLRHGEKQTNEGLRRVWWQCCREEGIDPRHAETLPLLFALDAALSIPGGYRYTPDCRTVRDGDASLGIGVTQCGGDFSSTSYDGGTDGLGDGDGGSGDGGDGGGCGGD